MAEWQNEPDELYFEAHGLKCRMRRGPLKHWCGYVAVPEDHPLYGKHYSDKVKVPKAVAKREFFCAALSPEMIDEGWLDLVLAFDVHGGLTYSKDHSPSDQPDGLWWFGFDCAHSGDFLPEAHFTPFEGDVYRNEAFVRAETESLARQLNDFRPQESNG